MSEAGLRRPRRLSSGLSTILEIDMLICAIYPQAESRSFVGNRSRSPTGPNDCERQGGCRPFETSQQVQLMIGHRHGPKQRPQAQSSTRSTGNMKSKNTICLWFDKDAHEAARFYAATFPDSKVTSVREAPADYPGGKKGDVLTAEFTVAGIACL